ncbi:interferon-induced transmembrane protein 1-like [Phoenicopterus ruber ruber]
MDKFPQSVTINMQPYGRNGAGAPDTAFGPTVTSFVQPEPVPSPRDFVLWSFFNTMFCNPFCLGFIALVFSIKARDKKIAQDPAAAGTYGRTAKHLNVAALCLGLVVTVLFIVLLVVSSRSTHMGRNF